MQPGNRKRFSQLPVMQEDRFQQQGPPSEGETNTQLKLAHGARGGDYSECGGADSGTRRIQAHDVENIVGVGAQLQIQVLLENKVARDREVHVFKRGATEHIAPRVSIKGYAVNQICGILRERSDVEPPRRGAIAQDRALPRHELGSLGGTVAGQVGVFAIENGKREAAMDVDDWGDCPSIRDSARQEMVSMVIVQLPYQRGHELMAKIEIRWAAFQAQIGHVLRAALCGGVVELDAVKRVAKGVEAVQHQTMCHS